MTQPLWRVAQLRCDSDLRKFRGTSCGATRLLQPITSGHSVWKNWPSWLVGALVGVGAEEVALGLEEVGGEAGGAVAVVVAEAGAECGNRDAVARWRWPTTSRQFCWVLLSTSLKNGSSMQVGQAWRRCGRRR